MHLGAFWTRNAQTLDCRLYATQQPTRESNCNPHNTLAHMSRAKSRPPSCPASISPTGAWAPAGRLELEHGQIRHRCRELGVWGRDRSWGQRHPYSAPEHESAGWPVTRGTKERAMEEEWHCTLPPVGSRRGAELGVRWPLGGKLLLGVSQPGAATVWAGRARRTESKGLWPLMDSSQGRHSFPWPPGISPSCLQSNKTASLIDPRGGGPPLPDLHQGRREEWVHALYSAGRRVASAGAGICPGSRAPQGQRVGSGEEKRSTRLGDAAEL
jgi:hypothetical protein